MPDRLVTIATFDSPTEAHILQATLEDEGIQTYLADENIVGTDWLYAGLVGGVKLQVRQSVAKQALAVLERLRQAHQSGLADDSADWPADAAGEPQDAAVKMAVQDVVREGLHSQDAEDICPFCGSTEVEYEKYSRKWFFLSILLLGFPLPFLKRKWSCRTCGASWKQGKG